MKNSFGILSDHNILGLFIAGIRYVDETTNEKSFFNNLLGNSKLFQSTAGNVGIGTTSPAAALDVHGAVNAASGFNLGGSAFAFGSFSNRNAFLGFSGNSAITGQYNTASGVVALSHNTTASSNTASGFAALYANTTGNDNTASGAFALYYGTTGTLNTALGYGAGPDSDSPNLTNTTAIGAKAVVSESNALVLGGTGSYAVKVGIGTAKPASALDVVGAINTSTSFNLGGDSFSSGSLTTENVLLGFAGNSTMTGQQNTASGYQALHANATGQQSTAIGDHALFSNTTGTQNTALGFGALSANTTGGGNIAIGISTLSANTTGSSNTAIGGLPFNTTGNSNTVVGFGMYDNTTGSDNTAVGVFTLSSTSGNYNTATGYLALYSNPCDASYNTAIGYSAGYISSSEGQCGQGNRNTYVGANTMPTDLRFNNATAIGANAQVATSNAMVLGSINGVNGATASTNVGIGTTTPSNVFTIGQGAGHAIADGWDTYSSRRWKTNIQTLQDALGKVEQLRGVSYDLKASGKHEVGVIAEEVGAVVPEVVSWDKNGKGAQGVDYSRLTALLIEATKEQQALIHNQQEQIMAQQKQISRLTSQVKVIQASLRTSGGNGGEARIVKIQVRPAQIARGR